MENIERDWFNLDAVFSDETSNFRTPVEVCTGDSVRLRIQTAKDDVEKAYLHYDDKKIVMKKSKAKSEVFDIFEVEIKKLENDIEYYFSIKNDNREIFYNKKGPSRHIDHSMNFKIKLDFATPDWAKGAVMYQIMVDRFCNGDESNDVVNNEYMYLGKPACKVEEWHKYPDADGVREFYGGDLQGVINKLDYLKDLGVDVIYFNPIFVSPSNHKYDTQDYDYVDPHIGVIINDYKEALDIELLDNKHAKMYIKRTTDKENLEASNKLMQKLIGEAHKKNIKVILDGVFNHCGSFNKWLDREDFYAKGEDYPAGAYQEEDSPYNKYFRWYSKEWPKNDDYDGWWGHKTLPKLNYENSKELEDKIIAVAKKWVSPPYNADGWRLDVAADLGHSEDYNHKFWKRFRKEVKEINKDAIIIAEHYGNPKAWLKGEEWDTIMNYDAFMEPVGWFLTGMEKHSEDYNSGMLGNATSFRDAMIYNMANMHVSSIQTSMNQLSNHDHSRFLTRTNKMVGRTYNRGPEAASYNINKGVFKEAVVMQMTWPGAPTLYYGDEAGVTGWTDPDNRRTYPWGREDMELLSFHKDIIGIHKKYEALKSGSVKVITTDYNILAYGRWDDKNKIVSVFNNNDAEREINIPVWQVGVNYTDKMTRILKTDISNYYQKEVEYTITNGNLNVKLPPYSSAIFVK